MSRPTLKVTSDFTVKFNEVINKFKKDSVLVGIPEANGERDEDAPITNAAILAINHFGSEAAHIKPWPVLPIGIKNAQEKIADQFKICAQTVLSKGTQSIETYYERVGIIASQSVKKVINDQDQLPSNRPEESTLRARKYITKSGFKGTKALVVTGQLRNAITYVVKSIWGR